MEDRDKWRVPVYEDLGEQIGIGIVSVLSAVLRFTFKFTPQAKVKLGQAQVELLHNVCEVLEPFHQATLQLSNDAACISEVDKIDPERCTFTFMLITDRADPHTAQ